MLESAADFAGARVASLSIREVRFNWAFVGITNWSLNVVVELSNDSAKSCECAFSGHDTASPLRSWLIACCASIVA
jgi:hypothetical protein